MRRRLTLLIIFPIAILLWIIGWTMASTSPEKRQPTKKRRQTKKIQRETIEDDSVTMIPMIPEEIEQLED